MLLNRVAHTDQRTRGCPRTGEGRHTSGRDATHRARQVRHKPVTNRLAMPPEAELRKATSKHRSNGSLACHTMWQKPSRSRKGPEP